MVLGKSEDEIDKHFLVDFNRKGVQIKAAKLYLIDSGLSVIEKKAESSNDRKKHNKRMLTPFAHAHIVNVQPYVDDPANHAVVMTRTGKIYDPSIDPADEYYYVLNVLGIFWD